MREQLVFENERNGRKEVVERVGQTEKGDRD